MAQINRTVFGRRRSLLGSFPKFHHRVRLRYLADRTVSVPQGPDMIVTRVLGNCKMYLDPQDHDISPHIMLDGYWEPRMTETIVDLLRPGRTAVDAGANLGYFTVLMGGIVGPRGRIVSCEPNPATLRRLEATIALNGFGDRVTLCRDPLGAHDGEAVNLLVEPHHPGGTHITTIPVEGRDHFTAFTRRLDGIPEARDATLVKIDTEGSEERIWQGMAGLIAGSALRYVLMEYTQSSYRQPADFLAQAEAAGFALLRLDDRAGPVPTTRAAVLADPRLQMLLLRR